MSLPTASELARAKACPGSTCQDRVKRESEYASAGDAGHKFVEAAAELGRDAAVLAAPAEYREFVEAIDLAELEPFGETLAHEVAFAYDPGTGQARELGRGLERDYSGATSDEMCGTADVVGVHGDEVYVGDWKFGAGTHVTPAARNLQLRALGLYAARAYGKGTALIELVHRRPDESIFRDAVRLSATDLLEIEAELAEIADSAREAKALRDLGELPPLTIGSHCKYCPSLPFCPAQTHLVRQAAIAPQDVKDRVTALLDYENVGKAWSFVKGMKELVSFMEQAIHTFAAATPVDMGNGMILGMRETTRESVDGNAAYEVLRSVMGADVADASVAVETSKTAIRNALREVAKVSGKPLAALEREVLAALRKAGAITSKTSSKVGEYKAGSRDE